jgi:hypothetical protein
MYEHEREDTLNLRDLVLQRMSEEFCPSLPFVAPSRPVLPPRGPVKFALLPGQRSDKATATAPAAAISAAIRSLHSV